MTPCKRILTFVNPYKRFEDIPSLGPGRVEESCATQVLIEEVVATELDVTDDASGEVDVKSSDTPFTSRCPSRLSSKSEWDDVDDDNDTPRPKKLKSEKGKQPTRVGKKRTSALAGAS